MQILTCMYYINLVKPKSKAPDFQNFTIKEKEDMFFLDQKFKTWSIIIMRM